MATINSKIEGVDVLGVVTAGETIYVGRATSTQHGIVKPAATDFDFNAETNALLVKLGVGLKRTDSGIAIAIYDGSVVTDVLAVEGGLEIKYADIDEGTENSKVISWSELTAAEIEYLKKYFSIEPGIGDGAVQQIGAKANGKQSAAFGGLRYDKQTGRTPTSADGNQSFAAGGSVHAEGDFSAAFGKDVNAYQKCSFAAGGGCEAGLTKEEFDAFYWDPSTNTALHHGKGKDANGNILNEVGETYEKSYSLGAAFGETNKTFGRGGLTAGSANVNKSQNGFTTGLENVTDGWFNNAFGQKNRTTARNSIVAGYKNAIGYTNTEGNTPENWTELPRESVRDSSSFGVRNTNKHIRTHTVGSGLVTSASDQVIVGTGNTENSNAAFQVGTGTYDQTTETVTKRATAFEVLKDGRAKLQAGPVDDDDVVRKADLGYEIDFPYGEPTVRCDNTDGITVTGTMRIYLNQAKTVFRDVPNVSVEIPIFAGKNITIDADETNKKAVVKASDVNVDTLVSLLLSSNGIKLTENEAGDRLLIGISRLGFELGTFEANGDGIKFAYNDGIAEEIYLGASLGGAIDIYNSLVSIDNYIRVKATADEYIEINNENVIYHTASGVKHYLREDTVKTIGGQSIYGSGDIPISGDIPPNINTFTEAINVLTLTASDTIHTLCSKIIALGQSVINVRPNDTARRQVDRIMGNPSTDGPPTSYCDYWFKVLSEHLIYVFFGYGGEYGLINYLYNSSQNTPGQWSMCPRWMPIDPSKIEGGVADPLTLANGLNIGTLGSDNEMPSYLKLTTGGIAYMLGSSAVSHALFAGGPIGNVKTLFGNQSIYGTGNIDLYKHTLEIKIGSNSIFTTFYSSNNLNIDSLTDWKTVAGNEFSFPAWGMYNGQAVRDVTQGGFNSLTSSFANNFTAWAGISFTIIDNVKTI